MNAEKDLSLAEFVAGMTRSSFTVVKTSDKSMLDEGGSDLNRPQFP